MNDERHALFGAAGRPTRRPGRAPPERPPGASKTGLSLAESVVLVGDRDGLRTDDLVGPADTFFSYSWTGTALGDVLAAVRRALARLAAGDGAAGGARRLVWVDMFCASQNLLAGAYRDPAITKESDPAGYAARKEDTDRLFEDAFEPVRVVILYASPLLGRWVAPPHPFRSAARERDGPAPTPWVRRGPRSLSRAWCNFELSETLRRGHALLIELSPADHAQLPTLLRTQGIGLLSDVMGAMDARDAQVSKVEDRAYIVPHIEALEGGFVGL